jgi:Right handed beta helix region
MMRNMLGSAFFVLAATAGPTAALALATTVHCPGETIAAALDSGFDEITLDGTCTENVEIRQDGVTIQGDGDDTVKGELFVNGAQRVTIQNLKILGEGTPGLNGIVSINSAAVRIANVTIEGIGDHGVIVLHGASADLNQVTVRNSTRGIVAEDNGSFQAVNSLVEGSNDIAVVINRGSSGVVIESTIQNNSGIGILFALGGGGNIINSTIQNNGGLGIAVTRGASAAIEGNTIQGSPLGVSVDSATAELANNVISTSLSDDAALDMVWGASVFLAGGNTLTSQTLAIYT